MKHWQPYIADAVREMAAAGIESAVALALAPHYSELSVGAYIHAASEADSGVELRFVRSWHLQPAYLEAVAAHVRLASAGFEPEVVVFTAHSLPRRILDGGDPYVGQLEETAWRVAAELALPRWEFSFQSAGATGDAWLGPDILESIDRLAGEGARRVLVAPIGFISDHLEILYDLDVQARQRAAARGIELRRIESLNADPLLIQALKAAVLEAAAA
jgi:ferrochelatase